MAVPKLVYGWENWTLLKHEKRIARGEMKYLCKLQDAYYIKP
jgi:hypothetical protein